MVIHWPMTDLIFRNQKISRISSFIHTSFPPKKKTDSGFFPGFKFNVEPSTKSAHACHIQFQTEIFSFLMNSLIIQIISIKQDRQIGKKTEIFSKLKQKKKVKVFSVGIIRLEHRRRASSVQQNLSIQFCYSLVSKARFFLLL